jgi:Reverse transcriptase (RNA-dependent DNA polymerase)/GIY-YIG catalytic domain
LTKEEKDVLNLGLNYAVTGEKVKLEEAIIEVERNCRNMGDTEQKQFRQEMGDVLRKSRFVKPKKNLTKRQKCMLDKIREREDIVIVKADKGRKTVVMKKEVYDEKVEEVLKERSKYEEVKKDDTKSVKKRVEKIVRRLEREGWIQKREAEIMLEDTDRIAILTTRVKLHKEGQPLRQIISQVGTPCSKTNDKIVEGLNSLNERNTYRLKNADEFKKKVNQLEIEERDIVFSMDVVDMFTNVPVEETMEIVEERLGEVKTKLPKPDFMELLKEGVNYRTFRHGEKLYKQKRGFPMGSGLSPALCEVFMNKYEKEWMEKEELRPEFYRRYVDDGFGVWKKGREKFEEFKQKVNALHGSIKWTFEEMKEGELPYLDCLVMKKGSKLTTKVYRKPTHSGAYINYSSNHSMSTKHGIIRVLTKRAKAYCDEAGDLREEIRTIEREFVSNGYPRDEVKSVIKNEMSKEKTKKTVTWEDEKKQEGGKKKKRWFMINRMENIGGMLRRVCKKFDVKVIEKPTKKIEQFVAKKKQKEEDPVGVVYEITCKTCGATYIGETGRSLSERVKEHEREHRHHRTEKSSVAKHAVEERHEIDYVNVRILAKEKNKVRRKMKEAIEIAKNRPKMNENDGWNVPQEWKDLVRFWDIPLLRKERVVQASSATSLYHAKRRHPGDTTGT